MPAKPPAVIVASKLSFPPSGVNCSFRYSYVKKYIPLAGISGGKKKAYEGTVNYGIVQVSLREPKMAYKHYVELIIASRACGLADRRHPV